MIWFDLDNSPHVPLFRPILRELDACGVRYVVTARDHAQTLDLLRLWSIAHTAIGIHAGRNKVRKMMNLVSRARELSRFIRGRDVTLAVSHGSRPQLVAAWQCRIRSVVMLDYEYTESRIFNALATHLLIPSLIPDVRLRRAGFNLKKVLRYDGFKEELYLSDFAPEPGFRTSIGVPNDAVLVIMRPPSVTGNYHNRRSEELFVRCLEHCSSHKNVVVIIANRTTAEADIIPGHLRARSNIRLLETVLDGLQLLWHSDLFIGGGGTMNREGALLGVPVFSIFTGPKPYLDECLAQQGRMTFVAGPADVAHIPLIPRGRHQYRIPSKSLPRTIATLLTRLAVGS